MFVAVKQIKKWCLLFLANLHAMIFYFVIIALLLKTGVLNFLSPFMQRKYSSILFLHCIYLSFSFALSCCDQLKK
jgi:hypothetical protein